MKHIIKKIFNYLGMNISKFNTISVAGYQTVQALKAHDINVVLDIGANVGQFASELREYGYTGKIVSFEPLPEAHQGLLSHAYGDENWIVHPRCAIGDRVGEIEINVAANSASSSILPMLSKHEEVAPHAKYTHKELATMITLDSVLEQYASPDDHLFIKIDTQGYEWAVLDGAERAVKKSKGVLLELSLTPLYDGQKLWLDLINRLSATHHQVFAIQSGFTDTKTGQTLQVDGLFFKATK